jgi:CheY-like chemotaxis protein
MYEKLLPSGQLVNRLQDRGYRVQPVTAPDDLLPQAERDTPMVVLADLEPGVERVCAAIAGLRQHDATSHIPVIAFASAANEAAHESARQAGATLVVHESAILAHLDQFLDQALHVE